MFSFKVKDDLIIDTDLRQKDIRLQFRNAVNRMLTQQKEVNGGRKLSLLHYASVLDDNRNEFDEALDLHVGKVYADILESYMAAVFLDSGNLV
jgi:hypothetical protein